MKLVILFFLFFYFEAVLSKVSKVALKKQVDLTHFRSVTYKSDPNPSFDFSSQAQLSMPIMHATVPTQYVNSPNPTTSFESPTITPQSDGKSQANPNGISLEMRNPQYSFYSDEEENKLQTKADLLSNEEGLEFSEEEKTPSPLKTKKPYSNIIKSDKQGPNHNIPKGGKYFLDKKHDIEDHKEKNTANNEYMNRCQMIGVTPVDLNIQGEIGSVKITANKLIEVSQ